MLCIVIKVNFIIDIVANIVANHFRLQAATMVQGIIHWMSIPSYCPMWDNRIGWTVRISMLCMVQGIIHWMSIPSYVGQSDRMDTEDRHAVYGTRDYTLDVHPILCGTIG